MSSVAKQTLSTTFWATIEKIGMLGIQFIIGMVLARLLSPSDYGIIALLMVFITIAQVFIDSGFGNALIRKQDCTNDDYSTAFYFNIVVGIVSYFVLFVTAPMIAEFYNMNLLTPVLRVYGLSLVFNSMTIVQNAILTQRLAFKLMTKCSLVSSLSSGIIALVMAYYGWGVWSLVFQTISSALLSFMLLSFATKWKPNICFSKGSFEYLWSFGSKALISSLISSLYGNIYSLVIGKFYTSADLGYFNRGQNTASLAPNIVSGVFSKSTLPLLSKAQNNRNDLILLYRKFTQLVAFVSFPLVFIIFALAKPFILYVLTEKWSEAVPYVQIFSISALTGAVGMINLNLLIALGRTDLTLKANVIKKTIGFMVVAALITASPIVLAIGCVLIDIMCYLVNLYYAKQVINLNYQTQLQDLLPYLLSSVVTCIITFITIYFIPSYLLQLVIGACISVIAYIFITNSCIKCPFYKEFYYTLKNRDA